MRSVDGVDELLGEGRCRVGVSWATLVRLQTMTKIALNGLVFELVVSEHGGKFGDVVRGY